MSAYTATELESVARRLGGAGKAGGGWSCRCPAHDDRTPSLSLSLGEGGRLLWHCFAGCDQAAVLDGLKSAGVLLNGDARSTEPRPKAGPKRRIVASYAYTTSRVSPCSASRAGSRRASPSSVRGRRVDRRQGRHGRRAPGALPPAGGGRGRGGRVLRGREGRPNVAAAGLCAPPRPRAPSSGATSWRARSPASGW
jgi:hypothetical protein